MYDGYFVFDNVVHMYDNSPSNKIGAPGQELADATIGASQLFSKGEYRGAPDELKSRAVTVEEATRWLFDESSTDMAVAQVVPVFDWYRNAFSPIQANYELARANPGRVLFCGGVDPLHQSPRETLAEMKRQIEELGAVSFKFYQSRLDGSHWRVDDREIAYPMWELCLRHGVTSVQFHKGLPFGRRQRLDDVRPNDIEWAARDFPNLNFVIHHLGEPYVDETVNIAARHPNVWIALSAWINMFPIMPRECLHRLGKFLFYVGPDRLMYGSEAFVWPHVEPYIKLMANMEMPEDLQDGYGYPQLTREIKRKILGENQARLLGIDIGKKLKELKRH